MVKPSVTGIDNTTQLGYWEVVFYPRGKPVDATMFRGIPVTLNTMSFSDPFGPKAAQITFSQITYFEELGAGDLWWLAPEIMVSLRFVPIAGAPNAFGGASYPFGRMVLRPGPSRRHDPVLDHIDPGFSWWGRAMSFDWNESGLVVGLQGILYQGDDFLSKPLYPLQPIPYEWAIAQQLRDRPALKVKPLKVCWPTTWSKQFSHDKNREWYMVPAYVRPGHNWTGLVTRQTGSWDPMLTSYIQTLLSAMYTNGGRWTLDLYDELQPILLLRPMKANPDDETVFVNMVGTNKLSLSQDWTQSLSVVYGQGTSLQGVEFSGMQVDPDGNIVDYEPLAALRQVDPPEQRRNDWFDPQRARREVMIQMQQGLDELQAQEVALNHLSRFSDPGVTGTITLSEDPRLGPATSGDNYLSKNFVRAGMSVHLRHALGKGITAHVTDNTVDFDNNVNTLTIDSKYRDALTANEVRMRGRDALSINRMLVVGQYQPPVPDQLIPWSQAEGSGCVPRLARDLFDAMPASEAFPWESWTKAHPPSKARWADCYIKLGPAQSNADHNWAWTGRGKRTATGRYGHQIYLAQAGTIMLTQIAAYDANGNVLRVPFHVSIYQNLRVNVASMPKILPHDKNVNPHETDGAIGAASKLYPPYKIGQHFPYTKDGWEQYSQYGTTFSNENNQSVNSAGLIRGWGDYYEKAGYWPGAMSAGNPATGLLVDEQTWTFSQTDDANVFNPNSRKQPKNHGLFTIMIYCDAQDTQDVYFLGRFVRQPPQGTGGTA